jgi:hypothetical protein
MSAIDDLDEAASAARHDRPRRMPAVLAESRRLMHDPDAEVRSRAVAIAWFAVRQMFELLSPPERVALSEAVSLDLEAAFAAGLVAPHGMLGNALRAVLRQVRERGGVID